MRVKQRPLLLLCAVFLLAQFAALLHVTQHEIAADDNASCEICAMAHVSAPPTAVFESPQPADFAEADLPRAPHSVDAIVCLVCPPATGPPASFV